MEAEKVHQEKVARTIQQKLRNFVLNVNNRRVNSKNL